MFVIFADGGLSKRNEAKRNGNKSRDFTAMQSLGLAVLNAFRSHGNEIKYYENNSEICGFILITFSNLPFF